jgi:hypothetical protein
MMRFQDIDMAVIKDWEDRAIGSGVRSQNTHLFTDEEQVQWLNRHANDLDKCRHIFKTLQVWPQKPGEFCKFSAP